ncbi:MAG TPA: hypothetical protein PKD59_07835 [Miltoncostaeaceae bacterium]|nr:hypothetical protein [Miltoncostaeaceae bacterium]
MRAFLRGAGRVARDLLVGDDPVLAIAVGLGLAGTGGLAVAGLTAWWLLPVVVVAATWMSLRRAVGGRH